ncbi:MAG: S1 RNA-binding domain-containing protein [Calditrichaeota bacterium]|nr:MAG: S1 RNA-binding domain-containing protein [Calditrichota bacterium]
MAETRIALLEEGTLVELFVELPDNERMVGDIHLGRVVNVVKGMRAAFIDIGQKQDAFLHFSDIGENLAEYSAYIDLDSVKKDNARRNRRPIPVEGQEILVQIIKEPISKKGSRITTEISIPGRFFVLVPNSDMIGVSKKVVSVAEKRRLKHLGRSICPKGFGLIIRTVAAGKDEAVLRQDLANLLKTWRQIEKKLKTLRPPSLVFKDVGMASSVIRDLFTGDVKRVVVDSQKQYKETVRYLRDIAPQLINRVELYKEQKPLFDVFGIESEIEKSLSRKVWTRSGGYILFDHTEALVAIDVNSGKFIGRGTHDENSLRINIEAGREIARQLRLRDIGGIIVIDFIDMVDPANRKKLYSEFTKELQNDRAQSSVSPISEFGLIEMTRERIRPSLMHTYSEPCPACQGSGRIYSKNTLLTQIERSLSRIKAEDKERSIKLTVNPEVSNYLSTGLRSHIRRLMWKYWVKIELVQDEDCALDDFTIYSKKNGKEIDL